MWRNNGHKNLGKYFPCPPLINVCLTNWYSMKARRRLFTFIQNTVTWSIPCCKLLLTLLPLISQVMLVTSEWCLTTTYTSRSKSTPFVHWLTLQGTLPATTQPSNYQETCSRFCIVLPSPLQQSPFRASKRSASQTPACSELCCEISYF